MRYKLLGKTGMNVSEMALGTWGIGGAGWDDNPEETRLDAIRAAVECGINMIDTAPAYNGGVARALYRQGAEGYGCPQGHDDHHQVRTEFINGTYVRSCARDTILRECEESLRNLQTDYIDLYLIHWPDAKVPMEETMDALNTLKQQGKVLHVGVSNFTKEQTEEANRYCPVEVYQPQYSMVFRTNEPQIKWAAEQGIGVMTYGSLGAGILTGAYRSLRTFADSDNRNRFYKFFQEPMFSKVQELLKVMDQMAAEPAGAPLPDRAELGIPEAVCLLLHRGCAEPEED